MSRLFVRESDAVSVATLVQIKDELQAGVFHLLAFWQDWMYMQYGFAFLRGRSLVPAAEVFMEEARQLEQGLAEEGEQLWRKYFPATDSLSTMPYATV